jgi:hypothetical protein
MMAPRLFWLEGGGLEEEEEEEEEDGGIVEELDVVLSVVEVSETDSPP